LALLLGLPLALAADPPGCAPLRTVTFDNATVPGLLGQWIYIAGASRYKPHLAELRAVKHAGTPLSPCLPVDDQVSSMAELIQSDKDLLVMKHLNPGSPGLSFSARTPNVTKEQMEEFKAHLHCLGFTEDDVFFTS
ncbi:A1AG protein, partial [Dromas ardeola]|nr:A1AG protein [Dromas ardeola]